jgi:hypothetical protein
MKTENGYRPRKWRLKPEKCAFPLGYGVFEQNMGRT